MAKKSIDSHNSSNVKKQTRKQKAWMFMTAWALAATLLISQGCSSNNNSTAESKKDWVELASKKTQFTWFEVQDLGKAFTENLDWIKVSENQETMKLFLSNWDKKLSSDFDDIKWVWSFDNSLYFIGVNNWKPAIINEKWDTIFTWMDEISEYSIHNWDIAVIWRKNWKSCVSFNGKIIDEWHEYWIHSHGDSSNWIYIISTDYQTGGDYKLENAFINGKKVWPKFAYSYYEDWHFNWGLFVLDYGEWYVIFSWTSEGDKEALIVNWKTIWTNLSNIRLNSESGVISYLKNWKEYVLFTDGKEYIKDKFKKTDEEDPNEDDSKVFVHNGNKSYYISDWKMHEYDWKHVSYIDNVWKTSDWKIYFVGHDSEGESFFLDWEKIWTLEHITSVWTAKDGTLYLKWWEYVYPNDIDAFRRNVIYINWTIRDDFDSDDSHARLTIS